jgi:hypothetical protein
MFVVRGELSVVKKKKTAFFVAAGFIPAQNVDRSHQHFGRIN